MRRWKAAVCAILALTMLCLCFMSGCGKEKEEGNKLPLDKEGRPCIEQLFSGEAAMYEKMGEATLTEVDNGSGGKALHISDRKENNSGVSFDMKEFIGNTVNVSVRAKTENPTLRATLGYQVYGNWSYTWIVSFNAKMDRFYDAFGTIEIPSNAAEAMIYVEADDNKDIILDKFKVYVEGDYVDPSTLKPAVLADTSSYKSLKELYKGSFDIGVAVPTSVVDGGNSSFIDMVKQQYSAITLENEFKPENILDRSTTLADVSKYNECPAVQFEHVKKTLDFAKDNGIKVRGHVLIWHSQTPSWLFYENYDTSRNLASRELMLKRMEGYIKSVLEWCKSEYPGLFYAWDVVNEAADDGSGMRDSYWTQTVGEDFVQQAFKFARQYGEEGCKLFYNDYNECQNSKKADILEMLKPVAEAGNIDGMGMQAHISTSMTPTNFVAAAKEYADTLGVVINVTELDVSIPSSQNAEYDQGKYFEKLFKAILEADKSGVPFECVTLWGLTDDMSWKSTEKPLIFNGDLTPKSAYYGVVGAVTGEEIPVPDSYVEPVVDLSPIVENYEDGTFSGKGRYSAFQKVVEDDAFEGSKCLKNGGGDAEYDGYAIDVTRLLGQNIKFSFAVKTKAASMSFTADIENEWPHLVDIDTSSGNWVEVEGTYTLPEGMSSLRIYLETCDMNEFYLDDLKIEVVE